MRSEEPENSKIDYTGKEKGQQEEEMDRVLWFGDKMMGVSC